MITYKRPHLDSRKTLAKGAARKGRPAPAGAVLPSGRLEALQELANRAPQAQATSQLQQRLNGAPAGSVAPVVVQRSLIVGATDYTAQVAGGANLGTTVQALMLQLDAAVNGTDIEAAFLGNRAAIEIQLTKWVEHRPGILGAGPKSHPVFGRKAQSRRYDTNLNLARGLLGWVESKPARHREKTEATRVAADPATELLLESLLSKIYLKIQNLEREGVDPARVNNIRQELQQATYRVNASPMGTYYQYLNQHGGVPMIAKNPLAMLQDPSGTTLRDKIVILHDLMEFFGPQSIRRPISEGQGLLAEPSNPQFETATVGVSPTGVLTRQQVGRGMGLTSSTRDETHLSTLFGRQHGIPLWASQSYTTARMTNMADWVGATNAEKTALASGIFAFWRNDYDHTSIAYHTLHEVFDIALNFGVDYDPMDPYAKLTPHSLDTLGEYLDTYLGDLRSSVNHLLSGLDKLRVTPLQDHEIDTEVALIHQLRDQIPGLRTEAEVALDNDTKKQALRDGLLTLNRIQASYNRLNLLIQTLPAKGWWPF